MSRFRPIKRLAFEINLRITGGIAVKYRWVDRLFRTLTNMLQGERLLFFCSYLLTRWINLWRNPARLRPQRILIFRLDEIGDMVTTLPVFEALKKRHPQVELTLFCKPLMKSLVQYDPNLDRIVTDYAALSGRYDVIIDLRGDWDSLRFALGQRPKLRLDRGSHRFINRLFKREQEHELLFNLKITAPVTGEILAAPHAQIYTGKRNIQQAELFVQRHDLDQFVVFHTGARKLLRRWGLQSWATLAAALKSDYGYNIVFAGAAEDVADIKRIQDKIPFETFSFADKGNLLDYAALVTLAQLMVGNESGPMHIAAATGTPTLALFGPGQPEIFAPFGEQHRFLHIKLACNPCDQLSCVFPENPCMNRLKSEQVLTEIHTMLHR